MTKMPATPHDAIIVCLDIGKSTSAVDAGQEKTFFERSKECVSWIIQRKLISQSPDVLSIILIGSDDSNHSLSSSGYNKICCKFDFQFASWEMLKFVETEVKTTENESDWIGALVISMEMLKVYEEFNLVMKKKIVLFSDFSCSESNEIDVIAKNMRNLNINLTIIGSDNIRNIIECESFDEPAVKRKRRDHETHNGEGIISRLWKEIPELITICSFEGALKQLCSYTRKAMRKTPWNCILDIGDVKISISMYKKTDPKSAKKFDTKYVKSGYNDNPSQVPENETVPVVRDKVMHYKHEKGEGGEVVDVEVNEEDTIEGFRYGNTIIPFTDADKAVMAYKPGPKSFSVIGFTSISLVPFYLISGECSYYVLPRDKDKNAEVAFSAIIQAMKQLECLAVVRRVYSNDRGLSLGILYPFREEISEDDCDADVTCKECLIYVELAFDEEVRSVNFPPLENIAKGLTKEQVNAVDELIDGMDLMNADVGLTGEPCEAFDIANLHDFKEQFFHYCVIQRGLYPDAPLPKHLPKSIENYIKLPKSVENRMQSPLRKIRENFKIDIRKTAEEETGNGGPSGASSGVDPFHLYPGDKEETHFSTSRVEGEENASKRCWMNAFAKGFPSIKELDELLCDRLIVDGNDEMTSAFKQVLMEIRQIYTTKNPDRFNWWMTVFKGYCHEKSDLEERLWNSVVVNDNLGLISVVENKFSRITEAEADDFLHLEVTKSLSCFSPAIKDASFGTPTDELDEFIEKEFAQEFL